MHTRTLLVPLSTCVLFAITAVAQPKGAHEPVATTNQPALNAEHDPAPPPQAPLAAAAVNAFNAAEAKHADHLDALYGAMRAYNASADGSLYWFSNDNALASDWIQQTPNVWGKSADDVRPGAGIAVAHKITALVGSAQKFVDITSLSPFPTGQFQTAIIDGLKQVAHSGRPVTVRILVGWYPSTSVGAGGSGGSGGAAGRLDQYAYLRQIIAPLKGIAGSKLKIYAGAMQVSVPLEWNHSKMVAVDGQRVLLGGENIWDADYLQSFPAHDLNVALTGPFVLGMHNFADRLWGNVCGYWTGAWKPAYWESGWNDVDSRCLSQNGLSRGPATGNLRVLGAGRLGGLMSNGNAADVGMALALRTSTSTIRIAQQDIGSTDPVTRQIRFWWDDGMTSIAKAIVAKQHVYIVLSGDDAKAGPQGDGYWNGIPLTEAADKIKEYVQKQPGAPSGNALRDLLCTNLHLAPLRFGPSERWSNGWTFANHSKFLMIDDRLFYVGSENFYPVSLQEYGVFLNDANAAGQMKAQYWDKLWEYSRRAAISGNGTTGCHFK